MTLNYSMDQTIFMDSKIACRSALAVIPISRRSASVNSLKARRSISSLSNNSACCSWPIHRSADLTSTGFVIAAVSEEVRECPSGICWAEEECEPCNDPLLGLERFPGCLFPTLLFFGWTLCCDMANEPGAFIAPLGIAPTTIGIAVGYILVIRPHRGACCT